MFPQSQRADAPFLGSVPGIGTPSSPTPPPSPPPSSPPPPPNTATFRASGNGSNSDVITNEFSVPDGWYLSVSYNCTAFGIGIGPGVFVENPDGSFVNDPGVDMTNDSNLVDSSGPTFQPVGGTFRLEALTDCAWSLAASP